MDPKRKKIYVIVIVVSIVLAIGILIWSKSGGPKTDLSVVTNLDVVNTSQGVKNVPNSPEVPTSIISGAPAPEVFPRTTEYNTKVLDSSSFRQLQIYTTIDATGQLGRPDPFLNY
jgi:hypothetical protein